MKVTVKDCLELPIFKDSKIIAGERGLDNTVHAMTFLELNKPYGLKSQSNRKNEMVLVDMFTLQENLEMQSQTIQTLASIGKAAVILFSFGEKFETLNQKSIYMANELGLPVISMVNNEDITYSDVINDVMEKVLYGDNFGNRLISNTIFHLLNFEKHSNFQSAAREAAINNNFQIVLLSEDFNPIFSVETRHKTTIAEAIRMGIERDVNKSMVYTKIDVNGTLTYWGPVTINGDKHYMFIVDNEDSYSPGEITKLAEILELAMGMWKYSPIRDAKAEFIKALRRGNKSLAYSLKDEAEVAGDEILSVFIVNGINKDDFYKRITSFEKKTGFEVLKINEGDEVCGMILAKQKDKNRASCTEFYQILAADGTTSIFNVTGVVGIEGSADAYHLINDAWPFIQNIFPHKNIFSKYELALASNCINISLKGSAVMKNYMDLIEPLKVTRDSKGKQLLETLEIFVLDAGMNTMKTAKLMEIHTNTVQYRLKRIKEILDADITDNAVMPGLTMALAIERIEKITKML